MLTTKVLICDDAAFMRSLIRQAFGDAGFEVIGEAATGLEAIDKYEELTPELVTMDIIMPDMGGIDVVREIVKSHPEARILLCSAVGQEAMLNDAMQAGAKGYIVKPFQAPQLVEAAQRVLA